MTESSMKSFIFILILLLSFSGFGDEDNPEATTNETPVVVGGAAAGNTFENAFAPYQAAPVETSDESIAGTRAAFGGVSFNNCAQTETQTIMSRANQSCGTGRDTTATDCRERVAEELVAERCLPEVMQYQASQSIVSGDEINKLTSYSGSNASSITLDCSQYFSGEGESNTSFVQSQNQTDINTFKLSSTSSAGENGDENDEHYLSFRGCGQVFNDSDSSFYRGGIDLLERMNVGGEPGKKICTAYAKNYCNEEFNDCVAGSQGENSSASCHSVKTECLNFSDETKKKRLSAMVSTCFALKKANKRLKGLDEETDGEQFNYVTVDFNGQGFSRGGFGCQKGPGQMALDYNSCKKAAHAFNSGFIFGDVAGEVAIQGYGAVQGADIEGDASREAASGEAGAPVAAQIGATERRHLLARDQHIGRAGINGAKGASMLGFMTSFITPKKVLNNWCNGNGSPAGSDSDGTQLTSAESCALMLMYANSNDNENNQLDRFSMKSVLFPNGNVTANLGQNAVKNLMKALVEGVMAKLQDDQAKMVGQVKEEFENANFNQPQTGIDMADLPTFCSENPTAPSCANNSGNGSGGGSGFNVDFGNGISSTPNQIEFGNDDLLTGEEQQALAEITNDPVADIPDLSGGSSDGKGNSDLTAISPGSVSSNKRSGAGGGGGSAGGGGGGAGGGPGPGEKGGSAGGGALGKKVGGKYTAGSSRGYSSGKSAKKKTSGNPFDKLTGSGSSRSVASQQEKKLLPKNIRLFSAISKRYTEVNRSGRLENRK